MKPIFIAGPHGSGKTTLISKLIVKSDRFIKDDYEIDFSNDRLAMEMGATMIGIHAVISCKDKYYKIEDYHGIKVEYYPNLPVPDYEIESIRYMVRCLPDGVE